MKTESYFNEMADRVRELPLSDVERNQALEAARLMAGLMSRPRCGDEQVSEALRDATRSLCAVYGLAVFGKLPQDSDGRFVGLPGCCSGADHVRFTPVSTGITESYCQRSGQPGCRLSTGGSAPEALAPIPAA